MMSKEEQLIVSLVGGGPWGFRLQGGRDHATALIVSKVRKKSKAYNLLVEGDIVTGINGQSCHNLTLDDVMALVDNASNDLTLEIVRGAENKNNEEKENVAPSEIPPVSDGEKQKEVSQTQQVVTVTESPSIQTQQSLPIQQLPSPFQQAPVEQVALSKPAVVSQASAEEQVSVTVKLSKQKQQKATVKEEVKQTITKTQSTVTETHSTIKLPQAKAVPVVETVTEVKESKTKSVSQKTEQISDSAPQVKSQPAGKLLPTVDSKNVSLHEAQSDQIPVDSNLAIPSQLESVQEAVSVSEISEVQQAPVVAQQITVHNGPSTVETSQSVINHILTDKNIISQEATATISQSFQVTNTEIKEQLGSPTSETVLESKTSVVSSEKLITETHSPSVQEILSEVQQVLVADEQEKLKLLESKQTIPERETDKTVDSTSVKVVEAVLIQPRAEPLVQPDNVIKTEQIVNKEKIVLPATDKISISETDSQISLVHVKPLVVQASVTTTTISEGIQSSVEESKPVTETLATSVDQTSTLESVVQSTTVLVSQTQEVSTENQGQVLQIQTTLPVQKEQEVIPNQQIVVQNEIILQESPLQNKETQLKQELIQEKPQLVAQKQEVEILQHQPLIQNQEASPKKQEPVSEKQETLEQKQESLLKKQEVLLEKQEPSLQKPEIVPLSQPPKVDTLVQKLPSSQSQAPIQQPVSPFQQIPSQQTPVPQQALITNMGQGESKKESQPLSESIVVSQEPPRPLPQLENIPPVPAHLLKTYEEPPQKVSAKLPSTSFIPSHVILDTPPPLSQISKQISQEPIQPMVVSEQPKLVPLPGHIQDNIPEIPKHLLESDSQYQPAMHAKTLKEIHEKEIQRVAQEKTAYDSTAKMLQEFEELKSMQKRGEISEPTAFTIRQQNEVPFSSALVNGHIIDSNRIAQSQYSSSPSQQIQEYISPDNSTRRWITREKKEGPRQEEKTTETLQYQKGNVQVSQSTSHYKMSETHQYPPTFQTSQSKSVVWPPPPSSPSRNSPYMFQQPDIASPPLIRDYIWQPQAQSTPASVGLSDISSPTTEISTDDPEKLLQEPHESVSALRKRFENQDFRDDEKIYSSSSFFAEPGEIYPTMEEQIQSAKKIADSLSADANVKSKGATMFYKRKTKSSTWSHGTGPDDNEKVEEYSEIRTSGGSSPLKLFLDPRSVKDAQTLRNTSDTVYHNIVSPDVCHDLVKDLNSPGGKGASMFAKRRQKSEDWIIDEKNVKALPPPAARPPVPTSATSFTQQPQQTTPDKIISDLMQNPRIKLVKSPWEAALNSPIGSCDAAFEEYRLKSIGSAGTIVDTIHEAAGKKELPGPPESWKTTSASKFNYVPPPITPSAPRPLPKFAGEPSILASEDIPAFKTRFDAKASSRPFSPSMDTPNYNRSARGWTPVRSFESQEPSQASGYQSPLPTGTSEGVKPVFRDYNVKPRKWISASEAQSSLDASQLESRALSPGRQLSSYNSLPRSFGGSTRTQPGKLPANIWPRETKEDYPLGFSYQAPRSQMGGYGEEVGYSDL